MKFCVSAVVTVIKKGELKTSESGSRGHLVLLSDVDAGSVYVPLDIYNVVEENKKYEFDGIYQSFDGKNYIAWKSCRPFKG